jgi:hypothetical protein
MDMPDIKHTVRDEENQITYHVMAYRQMSQSEVLFAVRYHASTLKRKPKRGTTFTILTVIGACD